MARDNILFGRGFLAYLDVRCVGYNLELLCLSVCKFGVLRLPLVAKRLGGQVDGVADSHFYLILIC